MNKKTFGGVAGAVVGVSALVGAFIVGLSGEKIEGNYYIHPATDVTSRITIYLPYEKVPNATFYSLAFDDAEFGLATFAAEPEEPDNEAAERLKLMGVIDAEKVDLALLYKWGITVPNIMLDPITSLEAVVYDQKRQPIGHGRLLKDGVILFDFVETEVLE